MGWRNWTRCAVAVLLGAALVSCGDDGESKAGDAALLPALRVENGVFRDAMGRHVLLRGYNARVEGIFDVTFDDGRTAVEEIPPFGEADARRFEELGFNLLRLPVNWSGLEPRPLMYDEDYMRRIDAVVELARRHHFYVLVDMHQDAYSKEIGEDGAPLWAIVPPPSKLLEGPLTAGELDRRRLSPEALEAGLNFFLNVAATDGRPLQDAFAAVLERLVRRYAGDPAVAGFEAFNEPISLFNDPLLDAFHARLADAVHAVDATAPLFFEPDALRNQRDASPLPASPWSHGPGVYSPHIYTTVFSVPNDSWASRDPAVLAASMDAAAREARAWGTPLFVGEFGIDQTLERGPGFLAAELDLQDRFLASSAIWVWRETGTWGLNDGAGRERTATSCVVSRPFPRAVAGDILAIERPAPGVLRVRYRAMPSTVGQSHEVSASGAALLDYEVRCDGAPVPVERLVGRVRFTCPGADGEHIFELVGTPAGPC